MPHGSITFDALREYVLGDDLRRVHWRSSARIGTLMVREHVDTSTPDVTVLIDTAPGSYSDEVFEEAMEVAASVVVESGAASLPLVVVTTGGREVKSNGRGDGPIRQLDLLSELEPEGASDLAVTLAKVARFRRSDTLVVVTGDSTEPAHLRAMAQLARRFPNTIVVQTGTVTGSAFPSTQGVRWITALTGEDVAEHWRRLVGIR